MSISVSELAARWGCDRRTIVKLLEAGRLSGFILNPGANRVTWRISEAAVQKYEQQQQQGTSRNA